jgi:alpha-galactosidase
LIRENGIGIYRQDFNFPPLDHWRNNETSDRQGINENMHVQGYLQYWDELLLENPGLWIDSCSSGGRRNDIETMRRSVPLHYTDYGYGFHAIKLAFHRTLFEWIPYFKEATLSWDVEGIDRFDHTIDSYSFHCAFSAMLFLTIDIRRDEYDFVLASQMIAIWRRAAEILLYGDYYSLTPFHKDTSKWVSYQFEQSELNRGFIQAIRLPDAQQAELTIIMKNIKPDGQYQFEDPESGKTMNISGKELQDRGFSFALPPRSGQIWFYSY